MGTKVTLPKSVYDSFANDENDPMHPLLKYVGYMKTLGVEIIDGEAVIDGVTDYGLFSVLAVGGIVQKGGEVYEYPCYIKIAEDDYENEVPSFMPKSEKFDDEGVSEGQKKWSEYKSLNHNHQLIEGFYYIENDGQGGFILGSHLAQLLGAGFTVLTAPQMQELQPDEESV